MGRLNLALRKSWYVPGFLLLASCAAAPEQGGIDQIGHVVVIFQENWSFDGLYGKLPGANGIANARDAAIQKARDGAPYFSLPPVYDPEGRRVDPRFPANLANAPFDLAPYVPPTEATGDLVHRFYQNQLQINSGRNDRFVAWSDAGALTMSYYDATDFPEGRLAREFALLDNFFQGAFGGSFLNHMWLACACTPQWRDAPSRDTVILDAQGGLAKDGSVSPDGYVVNTVYSANAPRPSWAKDPKRLMPALDAPTLGDRLSAKGVSWAWYAGGWKRAVTGQGDEHFVYHHQPYLYFRNYAEGTVTYQRLTARTSN